MLEISKEHINELICHDLNQLGWDTKDSPDYRDMKEEELLITLSQIQGLNSFGIDDVELINLIISELLQTMVRSIVSPERTLNYRIRSQTPRELEDLEKFIYDNLYLYEIRKNFIEEFLTHRNFNIENGRINISVSGITGVSLSRFGLKQLASTHIMFRTGLYKYAESDKVIYWVDPYKKFGDTTFTCFTDPIIHYDESFITEISDIDKIPNHDTNFKIKIKFGIELYNCKIEIEDPNNYLIDI